MSGANQNHGASKPVSRQDVVALANLVSVLGLTVRASTLQMGSAEEQAKWQETIRSMARHVTDEALKIAKGVSDREGDSDE